MDERLSNLWGKREHNLFRNDLPEVALALTAYYRKRAQLFVITTQPRHVRLVGPNFNAVILEADWKKILPMIQTSSFQTSIIPVAKQGVFINPEVRASTALLDFTERELYTRILHALQSLFPKDFPVSP